ncbi:hypothetical protein EVAR_67242_1 [Eumeta japonica]|uniref:Uncharacterized protein n=1 Tax=Eumeta variegata TaxID=151549 RepID=A0A4C1YQR4_EUMVA|nr:hypothetical protein EVAR_67242_1 [Eumeta japonica]
MRARSRGPARNRLAQLKPGDSVLYTPPIKAKGPYPARISGGLYLYISPPPGGPRERIMTGGPVGGRREAGGPGIKVCPRRRGAARRARARLSGPAPLGASRVGVPRAFATLLRGRLLPRDSALVLRTYRAPVGVLERAPAPRAARRPGPSSFELFMTGPRRTDDRPKAQAAAVGVGRGPCRARVGLQDPL